MRSWLHVKPGLIGALAVVLLGAIALAVWGRSQSKYTGAVPDAYFTGVPPVDRQAPANLQTATFSLG